MLATPTDETKDSSNGIVMRVIGLYKTSSEPLVSYFTIVLLVRNKRINSNPLAFFAIMLKFKKVVKNLYLILAMMCIK